jgi:hypothetical protein
VCERAQILLKTVQFSSKYCISSVNIVINIQHLHFWSIIIFVNDIVSSKREDVYLECSPKQNCDVVFQEWSNMIKIHAKISLCLTVSCLTLKEGMLHQNENVLPSPFLLNILIHFLVMMARSSFWCQCTSCFHSLYWAVILKLHSSQLWASKSYIAWQHRREKAKRSLRSMK